ncbi:hypothetical protein Asp14428_70500 [Actinoplanes sp. NBRC 14428]|uniref:Uncharacterized protein n=1 Tax=Pseudosporangium ferrugineum TaxID=439699 RepID=A0A2T0S2K5_9ACTN|nr:hypothetical protein [Pseudosporangium ferrugineum]PRY27655.1 hypothetical protein CLV70_110242 [Pseudosporangium ferrugineum]BCJ55575.1 hypothetical protein Asp14428_70500 [Actinoplanes sp. NBRC 14428]
MTAAVRTYERPRLRRSQLNWLFTALPAFPLVLLVLRLWYLSRQDLPTMLLLVQYISPLGMISALVITLVWTVPAVVLVLRTLGGLLLVSAPDEDEAARRSLLALTALRMPDWVVLLAVGLAGFTWQMRMLPVLLMLVVAILGLTAVQRYPGEHRMLLVVTIVIPIVLGVLELIWVWPGIRAAHSAGEMSTVVLLTAPPLLGWLLTGPVPPRAARIATHWPAVGAALVAPFVVGVVFLRAPVLPDSAVEVGAGTGPTQVIRGQLITVDDTATTILRRGGEVVFVPNAEVRSKTLCPEPVRAQHSRITVRGWAVDQSALEWVAPTRPVTDVDPRCLGRPLKP